MHASAHHSFLLRRRYAEALILLVCDLTVLCPVGCVPVAGIIAAFAAFDADQYAGTGQRGKTEFWQTFCQLWSEAFLLGLNAPTSRLPEMGIQFHIANTDLMLLHALSEPITGLSGYIVFELCQFLAVQFTGNHTFGHAPKLAVPCFGFEKERPHLCVNAVASVVVFHESARRVQKL